MLYQFLMDDVVRKQPKQAQRQAAKQDEYIEGPTGELVASPNSTRLLRSRSTPKRKEAFHYPMTAVRRDSEEESQPNSPQLPAFAATKVTKGELQRGDNRLTM